MLAVARNVFGCPLAVLASIRPNFTHWFVLNCRVKKKADGDLYPIFQPSVEPRRVVEAVNLTGESNYGVVPFYFANFFKSDVGWRNSVLCFCSFSSSVLATIGTPFHSSVL